MCGLVGFVGAGDADTLTKMMDAIHHRGPDDDGVFVDNSARLFLGHKRLAIVDIAGGLQPMWDQSRRCCVVYNGEIYNHLDLRRQLEALGHRFQTVGSDTEVLIHGYLEWGEDLARRLNGMFAFVIYDSRERKLLLARDRMGEKPLFYSQLPDGGLAFGSELKAVLAHHQVKTSCSLKALQKFFGWGYLPGAQSLVDGVLRLLPGCQAQFDLVSGTLKTAPYWQFSLKPEETGASEDTLCDELEQIVCAAVARRRMSDVPIGVFLSGGVDSSLVLAMLSDVAPTERHRTFTIGFHEPSFDESPYAQQVADRFNSAHSTSRLGIDEARDLIPEVLSGIDEPLGDASLLPAFLVSRFAAEHVKVVLTGDGGDELFAGYDPFDALNPARIFRSLFSHRAHGGLTALANLLPNSTKNMSFEFKLKRFLRGLAYGPDMQLPLWMSPLEPKEIEELLLTPVAPEEIYEDAIDLWDQRPDLNDVEKSLEFFTRFYLPDNILIKSDRAGMMNSLETRAVYLDNEIVAFAERLPTRFKYSKARRKHLLKKVAERKLSSDIVNRKKKGFGVPFSAWARNDLEFSQTLSLVDHSTDFVSRAVTQHRNAQKNQRLFLWNWLSLQHFEQSLADS